MARSSRVLLAGIGNRMNRRRRPGPSWQTLALLVVMVAGCATGASGTSTPVRPTVLPTATVVVPLASPRAGPVATVIPTATSPLPPTSTTASGGIRTSGEGVRGPVAASAIAVSPDGRTVIAVNPDSNSVSLVDSESLEVIAEIPVGSDPRTVAVTPDSAFALVANHGGSNVSAVDLATRREVARWPVGPMPYGIVTDGRTAWISEAALGKVARLDLATGRVTARLDVEPFPTGMALSADGRLLLVTHLFTGRVTAIGTASWQISGVAGTGLDTNVSQFVAIAPGGSKAYLPQTRSNAGNLSLLFDTTVFPVVNVLRLNDLTLAAGERITLDTADRPVNMPFGVAVTPDGRP